MRTHPTKRRVALLMAPVLAAGLALGACGDDDDTEAAATTEAPAATTEAAATPEPADAGEDLDTFCAKSLEIEVAGGGEGPEEGDVEGGKAFAASLVPLATEWAAAAPASAKADAEAMLAAAEGASEDGDLSVFETPEFSAHEASVHAAGVEGCGWATTDVEMQDYHFMGLPATLTSGVMSFELTNTGNEPHVMIIVRKNDGVTESFDEILAMTEEESAALVTEVGAGFAAPGEDSYALLDLAPGEYLALCPIPVGWVDMSGPPPEGPPHFTEGMSHEFTVS